MVSRRTNRHLAQKRGRRGAAFFLPVGIVSRKEGVCKPRRRLQDTGQKCVQPRQSRVSLSRQQAQGVQHFSPKPGAWEHRAELPLENLDLEKTNEAERPKTVHEGTMPPN